MTTRALITPDLYDDRGRVPHGARIKAYRTDTHAFVEETTMDQYGNASFSALPVGTDISFHVTWGGTTTGLKERWFFSHINAVEEGGTGASDVATARDNLGLGTSDSPQFAAVNFSHASDTTVARSAAGRLTVESVNLVRGPSSATDNVVARYNGTTGDLIQTTGISVDDSDNVSSVTTLGIGTTYDADYGIYIAKTLTDTDNSIKAGVRSEIDVAKTSAAMTSSAYALYGDLCLDSTNTQNWTVALGLRAVAGVISTESGSTGTVTGAMSYLAYASIADAATVTNLYGLYVATPSVAGSKVTNLYGLYIADQNVGATLNYAIYTGAGAIRFGGNITSVGTITIGSDGSGVDFLAYGGTASNSFTWDASENVLDIASTMKAADNVLNLTVTDATTLSSGYGRAAYIGYTVSGTKTGSYAINGLGIDMTVSEACPTVSALEIYTAAISNKTVGNLYPLSIYCEDIGTAVSNFMALDIGINSTNLASSRHTGIRIRNHSGTATSAILIEEAFTDTIRRHAPSGADLNLITLDNSSGAIFYWDDSEQKFRFNKGLNVAGATVVRTAAQVIAANDSYIKTQADAVCDGTDD